MVTSSSTSMDSKKLLCNMTQLAELRQELLETHEKRRDLKRKTMELEDRAVEVLLSHRIPYVDESTSGEGPFWVLTKTSSVGMFTTERYLDFFQQLLSLFQERVKAGEQQLTPADCLACAREYLKQFERRRVSMIRSTQCRPRSVQELDEWCHHVGGTD